jgi:hypothetical protein
MYYFTCLQGNLSRSRLHEEKGVMKSDTARITEYVLSPSSEKTSNMDFISFRSPLLSYIKE